MPVAINVTSPHGLNSKTFSQPPLNNSLTVPELYDWHLEHSPNHPTFVYASTTRDRTEITFKQTVHAIHRAGRLLQTRLAQLGVEAKDGNAPVIGIFANTDNITYYHTWVGLVRAGFVVFHISHRNSAAAVAHLLQKTHVAHVLASGEHGIKSVLHSALEMVETGPKQWDAYVSDMPVFEDIFTDEPVDPLPQRKFGLDDVAFYIHSSGSTAFPKPLGWTHDTWLTSANAFLHSKQDLCGEILSCHAIPMFHAMGISATMFTVYCGTILSAAKPQHPPAPVTPEATWEGCMITGSQYLFSAPLFVETWARDADKVSVMKKLKGVVYGGGPLDKVIGDHLAEQGVNIYNLYGSSESGLKLPIICAPPGKDWDFFEFLPTTHPEFLPYDDGSYELIMVDCETHHPLVLNTDWNGIKAYATNDLLAPHPQKKGFWKVVGRTDDQIMLSSGEKTNPGPLENILRQDPHIQHAVMFGRGRFQNGVIVLPRPEFAFDPSNEQQLAAFRSAIWPTVERMNAFAPQHSRLFKEMILVASPSKPFSFTGKATARRHAIIKDYEPEIEALYKSVEESAQGDIPLPAEWNATTAKEFVRKMVQGVLEQELNDDDDFFEYGCDSLQATWIRNTLTRALRDVGASAARSIPFDLVYQNPTITALSNFVTQAVPSPVDEQAARVRKAKEMAELVEKYSKDFPAHTGTATSSPDEGQVVILTGTTGGLGSTLLAELYASLAVRKVYALNRRSSKGESIKDRQRRGLQDRNLDESLVDSEKVSILECDMTLPDFGLEKDVFEEMRSSTTTIIHNAYRVDFNVSLSSFEPQLLIVRRFINFALSSPRSVPPSILFTSSVSVLRNLELPEPAKEDVVEDPLVAVGNGYSESKWASERILGNASAAVPSLRTIVIRVGQMSGGATGDWNAAEWLPSLVASGPVVKCLPDLKSVVAWIPLDAAAKAMLDFSLADAQTVPPVLHLAHPHPAPWSQIIGHAAKRLGVPLVSYADWVQALEADLKSASKSEVEHMRENPALRLLPFFQTVGKSPLISEDHPGFEAMAITLMDMEKAKSVSPLLRTLPSLGPEDVDRWLAYWSRVGLLPAQ
ncbi:acetyl-CoA synthetase-like protein [Punctularia strigosozonata HHB-11173 SS5]|uniref:acetyl-CoA synthetase-like protein n=1 Tax=Punctularia strigosozonata (strain HHB-11173) TaxID=741275 RepID=UPI000441696F|nr:acetyl-CoA synthetase-like protein [Punctularia strigosozonata HHB-11173 SS5]EIN05406.1 acetyl-CoA synthetase-like protein [Punctularia strigosozonata HHB-11173 SS5]